MKLAFSTLGCPDWTFNEIVSTAIDLGFDGIEIRGIEKEVFAPYAKPFLGANIDKTISLLNQKNVKISLLATGVVLGENRNAAISESTAYIDLAVKLGVPFIRLMISSHPFPEKSDFNLAVSAYREICNYAKGKNVIPLVETNGILAESKVMAEFMEETACENSGVLWDIHHPYRYFNESVDETVNNIGKYVKYVHVKDSVMNGDKVIYKLMGQGDIPVIPALKALKAFGYNSYITLEWVKRWCPELEEAGIVFSHFSNYYKTKFSNL